MTLGLVGAAVAGCASSDADRIDQSGLATVLDPKSRAVRLETEGCGFASGRIGSGVAIGDGLVVTVAHLIVEAENVRAYANGQEHASVPVAAVDRRRDLAVLRLPSDGFPAVEMSSAEKGARGLIVGGSASGSVAYEVTSVVELTIEAVFGTTRHSRRGYELAASTADGDSGAGAYGDHGRLIGIVFATGEDGTTTWVTASSEIEEFLETIRPDDTQALCTGS